MRAAMLLLFCAAGRLAAIDGFVPPETTATAPAFDLTILGTGFVPGERFRWQGPGGSPSVLLVETFVNDGAYRVQIPANFLLMPGTAFIQEIDIDGSQYTPRPYVINPAPTITTTTLP